MGTERRSGNEGLIEMFSSGLTRLETTPDVTSRERDSVNLETIE